MNQVVAVAGYPQGARLPEIGGYRFFLRRSGYDVVPSLSGACGYETAEHAPVYVAAKIADGLPREVWTVRRVARTAKADPSEGSAYRRAESSAADYFEQHPREYCCFLEADPRAMDAFRTISLEATFLAPKYVKAYRSKSGLIAMEVVEKPVAEGIEIDYRAEGPKVTKLYSNVLLDRSERGSSKAYDAIAAVA